MINKISKLSDGNPGAMTAIRGLLNDENIVHSIPIITAIDKMGIIGTDIYVLWSDLSNKDYEVMKYLCENVPIDILKSCCKKQDYSGVPIVEPYIKKYLDLKS